MSIRPTHSYKATLWPETVPAQDVQEAQDKGALPTLRLRAVCANSAASLARLVTGQRVLDVVRVDSRPTQGQEVAA